MRMGEYDGVTLYRSIINGKNLCGILLSYMSNIVIELTLQTPRTKEVELRKRTTDTKDKLKCA